MTLQLWLLMALVIFGASAAGQLMRGRRVRWGLALIPPLFFLGAGLALIKVFIPKILASGQSAGQKTK
jgi:hypothetical protein